MERHFFPDAELQSDVVEPGKVTRRVRAHGGRLMMVEVEFALGSEGYAHDHLHEQTSYCLAGSFDFTVLGETRRLGPGDSVFIPGGARHGARCLAAGRLLDIFSPQREDFLRK